MKSYLPERHLIIRKPYLRENDFNDRTTRIFLDDDATNIFRFGIDPARSKRSPYHTIVQLIVPNQRHSIRECRGILQEKGKSHKTALSRLFFIGRAVSQQPVSSGGPTSIPKFITSPSILRS